MSDRNLNYIRRTLLSGGEFGSYYKAPDGTQFYQANLYLIDDGDRPLFGWYHYGRSANRATREELRWIINTIFETTPSLFLKTHIRRVTRETA